MEDSKLRNFCMVVDCASFSRAAEQCCLTQSAVSHLVKSLEKTLNTQLLLRRGRTVAPTAAGWLLYRHAQQILSGYTRLTEDIQELLDLVRGNLMIGAGSTATNHLLPQLLYAFGNAFQEVCIRVGVHHSRGLLEGLSDGRLDFAILEEEPADGFWFCDRLAEDELVVIAPENHPLAGHVQIDTNLLGQQAFVCKGNGDLSTVDNGWLQAFGLDAFRLQIRLVVPTTELVVEMVKNGLGLAVVSRWAAFRDLREGLIVVLDTEKPPVRRTFQLVRSEKLPLTAVSRVFLKFARQFSFFVPF